MLSQVFTIEIWARPVARNGSFNGNLFSSNYNQTEANEPVVRSERFVNYRLGQSGSTRQSIAVFDKTE
jgi:hypothetical protein